MAGLEDIIGSSAPGGNGGKPLMLALLALPASRALFGGGGAGCPASTGVQPSSDEGGGNLLGGLGGLLDKLQKCGTRQCGQFLGWSWSESAGVTWPTGFCTRS
jgi:hypothetical protein